MSHQHHPQYGAYNELISRLKTPVLVTVTQARIDEIWSLYDLIDIVLNDRKTFYFGKVLDWGSAPPHFKVNLKFIIMDYIHNTKEVGMFCSTLMPGVKWAPTIEETKHVMR